jgi:hypothetical protein
MPSRPILNPFLKFPDEAAIIGRLSAGYTTLEVGLMSCVQVVRDDFDAILKAMFRVRSETARIDIADALGRHFYDNRGLGTEFRNGDRCGPALPEDQEPVRPLRLV